MTDPLGTWWVHEVEVDRYAGQDAFGEDRYETGSVTGFYRDAESEVLTPSGELVTAAGRFAYPHSEPTIPLRSKITLPAAFDGQEVFVVSSNVADGPPGTPQHKIVGVK